MSVYTMPMTMPALVRADVLGGLDDAEDGCGDNGMGCGCRIAFNTKRTNAFIPEHSILCGVWMLDWSVKGMFMFFPLSSFLFPNFVLSR